MFCDAISKFADCKFEELKVTFYECYKKIQTYEQIYMALWMIKQGEDKKVEIYDEHIQKWPNYFHQANDNLLTTFFQAWLNNHTFR